MKLFYYIVVSFLFLSCSKQEDKILPSERELIESVYSSVIIQPDSLYQVYSIVSGIIDQNLVEEGAIIKKKQALIQIINNTPLLNTENSRLALTFAKENYQGSATILKSIKDEIASATLSLKNDSINFHRQKNLWDQKIGSKIEYDTKQLKYQLSQNNLLLLKSKYNQTENQLITSLKQAENNYRTSLINTKDFTIKSKINGKIYELKKEPGELVTVQEPIALVGSATRFIIEMLVDEVDIVQIENQMEVILNLDAYKGVVFTGKVSKIYPKKDERNQTFKVEAIFNEAPKKLYPGLSGEANIIIAKKQNALTIPKEYLIENNKVKTDDGFVTITLGLQNLEYVEVLSGITKDTYIYKTEK
ncbi:efflux transporter periplasmic adaptor subunit [Polaribacter vadi]|uniref:Efflux transporter periplasmic adaptor subunit n=1 Tax=Polaribacter vadi TaxID=1774273 RepID=A0A1B8TXG3_9FLAO|nr:HlyD family efflux transporter periplasmic adaptor subunit [Polaribacter vadi]AOW16838.1 efflux transporter periplasmic adaptor subunit [Polaribacter vadi]OBY64254.1 efflux transporter periplasmic adaptor subunit [Polaribacter vadi]